MSSFIEQNAGMLETVQGSSFSVYKKPTCLYENLINCIAVDLGARRSGDAFNCPVETRYKELKHLKFPEDTLVELVIRAAAKVPKDFGKQKSIRDFFLGKTGKFSPCRPVPRCDIRRGC